MREPDEERIARGMPERVVVGLEAVEVEEREEVRGRILGAEQTVEVVDELPAVGETGQRIGLEPSRAGGSERTSGRP